MDRPTQVHAMEQYLFHLRDHGVMVWTTCYNDGWWFPPFCPPALGWLQPACEFLCPWGLWEDAEKCISLFKLQPSTERNSAIVCAMLSTKRAQSWGLVLGAAATTGTTTSGSKQWPLSANNSLGWGKQIGFLPHFHFRNTEQKRSF